MMVEKPIVWIAKLELVLIAMLSACDPVRFTIKNDTGAPLRTTFRYLSDKAECHAPAPMFETKTIGADQDQRFKCTVDDIDFVQISTDNSICLINHKLLRTLGSEVSARDCLAGKIFPPSRPFRLRPLKSVPENSLYTE